jgi:transcriptional regulator with XRE-family HTH domain
MSTTFGAVLREKRRHAQISQRRLADLVGVDFSYISKLENDRLPPPAADTIVRIAGSIRCPSEELLAAAQKLPGDVGAALSAQPAAVRFLQEASMLSLSDTEWEQMRGTLKSLRDQPQQRPTRRP